MRILITIAVLVLLASGFGCCLQVAITMGSCLIETILASVFAGVTLTTLGGVFFWYLWD